MRVFVVCVERSGSVSFREACRYATNYTTGHETKCGLLEYPDQFIEVNAQLRVVIAHLASKYPGARWVHLIRDPEACIASLARLDRGAAMRHHSALFGTICQSEQPIDIAWRVYWSGHDLIRAQFERFVMPDRRFEIHLETVREQWPDFWRFIGAEGDLERSIAAWDIVRNSARERGEL